MKEYDEMGRDLLWEQSSPDTRAKYIKMAKDNIEYEKKFLADDDHLKMIKEIFAIAKLLDSDGIPYNFRTKIKQESADSEFMAVLPNIWDRREEILYLAKDGRVKKCSWCTSHHNGDPYGHKTEELSVEAAKEAISSLHSCLLGFAVSAEDYREKKLQEKLAHDNLVKKVLNKISKDL